MTRTGVILGCAALLAAGLAGCQPTSQFSGMLRYGNLMRGPEAEQATEAAREQLLARARVHGLEPTVAMRDRLVFKTQAPRYVVTLDDGTTEERIDPRVVHIRVDLDRVVGKHVYRYTCRVEGREPPAFSAENRARFGLALLALREVLETPIETELLGDG